MEQIYLAEIEARPNFIAKRARIVHEVLDVLEAQRGDLTHDMASYTSTSLKLCRS